jgi:ryanodine receptor 2
MEPETKVFPAIFVEATSKEVMQIELGRTSTTLPLSAALLQNSERHVIPQVRKSQLLIVLKRCKVM